ncbi:MAG: redoxin domain-containing protein [Actinoplanes sp.]
MIQALLVVCGLLVGTNLVFTYGVVRRLREHSERLAGLESPGAERPAQPPVGTPVPAFRAATTTGAAVMESSVSEGEFFIGFFSTTCPPCRERLPEFAALAGKLGTERFLAVVAGTAEEAAELIAASAGNLAVVVEEPDGPLNRAFGIAVLPTILRLADGEVKANASVIGRLGVAVPV